MALRQSIEKLWSAKTFHEVRNVQFTFIEATTRHVETSYRLLNLSNQHPGASTLAESHREQATKSFHIVSRQKHGHPLVIVDSLTQN